VVVRIRRGAPMQVGIHLDFVLFGICWVGIAVEKHAVVTVGELTIRNLPIVVVRIIKDLENVAPLGHEQCVGVEPNDVSCVAGLSLAGRIANPSPILRPIDERVVEMGRVGIEAVLVTPGPEGMP